MSWQEKFSHLKTTAKDVLGSPKKVTDILEGQVNSVDDMRGFIDSLKNKAEMLKKGDSSEALNFIKSASGSRDFTSELGNLPLDRLSKVAGEYLSETATFLEQKINDPKYSYRTSFVTATSVHDMMRENVKTNNLAKKVESEFHSEMMQAKNDWSTKYDDAKKNSNDRGYFAYQKVTDFEKLKNENVDQDLLKKVMPSELEISLHSEYVESKRDAQLREDPTMHRNKIDAVLLLSNASLQSAMDGLKTGKSSVRA